MKRVVLMEWIPLRLALRATSHNLGEEFRRTRLSLRLQYLKRRALTDEKRRDKIK
jgi:hypothetical protein